MKRYSDDYKKKICEEYLNTNITQLELSLKYGVSCSSISKWLAPYRRDDKKKFVRLAQKKRADKNRD